MTKNTGPSGFSAAKPAGIIPREDLIIGTHPWLFNKDRTRYGGLTVIPEHILAIKDDDKRKSSIDDFVASMAAKPLTDEEKWQKDEWDKLILNPGPLEYLDDNFADDMIAWSEGRGKFSAVPKGSTVENCGHRQ
ncbi:hypothetical protein K443DRAFT_6027 [Laccaria amethystina LaAM-08-1]|uniref:Uncharacterized protein n=1 Tax=Laccaria amethystina LaAM-08-1 TaxID=1095629 RepID=A0A0C9WRJ4_9AGAR|nr:hypothetical protein K443DRAFT_12430 [Laccaria amethystina LaAM-08-1]KIK02515.1 hypothetical protein K443DRAFT_6027 [Laccaria amethystina LaAM-08-1]